MGKWSAFGVPEAQTMERGGMRRVQMIARGARGLRPGGWLHTACHGGGRTMPLQLALHLLGNERACGAKGSG